MSQRNLTGLVGGLVFAFIWYLLGGYPLHGVLGGGAFAAAWFIMNRLAGE